jgi:N-acetylglucosamine kinase-like BadF-type ATPase
LVLAAAGLVRRGVAVIAGTGSLALAVNPEWGRISVGGWGTLLGDDGSAYDIAVNALRAVAKARDGRLPSTALTEAVCAWARIEDVRQLSGVVYGPKALDRTEIARLAVHVDEVARRGDEMARSILQKAGRVLAEQVLVAGRHVGLGTEEPIVIYASGGVLRHSDFVLESLSRIIKTHAPAWSVVRLRSSPALGAAALALEAGGVGRSKIDRLWNSGHIAETG